MPDLRFIKLAVDPTLIPGVYNGCDQWCDYCPVTERCLAFKCRPRPDAVGGIYHNIAEAMCASLQYLKDCHEAEGLKPPDDLLRLLADDPRKRVRYEPVDDKRITSRASRGSPTVGALVARTRPHHDRAARRARRRVLLVLDRRKRGRFR